MGGEDRRRSGGGDDGASCDWGLLLSPSHLGQFRYGHRLRVTRALVLHGHAKKVGDPYRKQYYHIVVGIRYIRCDIVEE